MKPNRETNVTQGGDIFKTLEKDLSNRIIEFLLESTGSVTEIAEKIGSTKAKVSESVRELESLNLVRKQILGRTHSYSFNYLSPIGKEVYRIFLIKKLERLNKKLNNLPFILMEYLRRIFSKSFKGIIFFGSCVYQESFNDIDLFLLFADKQNPKKVERVMQDFVNFSKQRKLSYIIGTESEVTDNYLNKGDTFYQNLMRGVPFGCLTFYLDLRFKEHEIVLTDIIDRTITGLREVINCLKERDDKTYVKKHMESGLFNIIYALLRYYRKTPTNDYEAMNLISQHLTEREIKILKKLKREYVDIDSCCKLANKLVKMVFD